MAASKILLVEGEADKSFFKEICKKLSLDTDTDVLVAPPKDIGGTHNTKGGVTNHLKLSLLPQLNDGQITRIGIVLDADYEEFGSGYQQTISTVTKVVEPFGFSLKPNILSVNGLFY